MGSDYATTVTAAGSAQAAALFRAMRPYQWPKNLIVFAAVAFSAGQAWRLGDVDSWWPLLWRSVVVALCWCLASSAIYLVNDIRDRELDVLHPRKRYRPIAAGRLSPGTATRAAVLLLIAAPVGAGAVQWPAGCIVAAYLAVMLAYSFGLKQVAILDVLILTAGLVARAVSGAIAIDVSISPWLYVCSGLGAFFFASSKRWAEARQLGLEATRHRPSLASYGPEILGQMLMISASGALIAYALYTIESAHVPSNGAMALTIPFVAFALFRYLLLLDGPRRGDAPDRILFTDAQILLALAGFVLTAVTVLLVA
jgi:4-hydroxybenzoate polyprenyltransferase